MSDEWKILEKVYSILEAGHVFDPMAPVVEFEYPENLAKIIDFAIDSQDGLSNDDIEKVCQDLVRYSVKTSNLNFHNQLFGGVDPYSLAGSWITEALNTSQYTYEVGPVFILIEDAVIKKCLQMFGLVGGDGMMCPGGSISNMYGMVAARYKKFPDVKNKGLRNLPQLCAFTSECSHYSIKKAVHWLGIGLDNLISVKTNNLGRMIPEELDQALTEAKTQGRMPFFVNSTAGTTVLGAFDDFEKIADVCEKHGVWLHIDGCMGGSAIFSKTHSHLLKGVNRAHSIAWNPHKTMGVPLQCSLFLIKEKGLLHACNSANANYLFQQDKFYDMSYDTGDKSVQCGRKVDAMKLWLMFKARGLMGIEKSIDNAFEQIEYMRQQLIAHPGYRLLFDEWQYTNICFWFIPKNLRGKPENKEWWDKIYKIVPLIKEQMMKRGKLMVGYSPLPHKNIGNFFRMVLTCHPAATKDSMDFVLKEIAEIGEIV